MRYLLSILIVGLFATVSHAQDFQAYKQKWSEYEYGERKEMREVTIPFQIRRDFEVTWTPTVSEVGATEIPCPTVETVEYCPSYTTRTKTRTRSNRWQRNWDGQRRHVQLGMINIVDNSDDDDVMEAGNFQRRAIFRRMFGRR